MVNKLTRRLIGILAMMVLMMSFTLQVNAGVVTVKSNIANGSVTVDKATADPGETVTITVTPNPGYYAEKKNVKGELTIDGGSAQAPGLKAEGPGVGSFVNILGDEPADVSTEATYTFTMPEAPYGVQVSAVFEACTPITASMITPIENQPYTGSAITPTVEVKDGDNTLTLNTDYTVEYSNNTELGQATIAVTGKGKYTGTATVNFKIYRETYEIRWGKTVGNSWETENVISMTKDETSGKWVAADQTMEAASEFKIVKKYEDGGTPVATWYGTTADGEMYWITTDNIGTEIKLYQDNKNLYFPNAGVYTFTFDPSTSTLVVTGNFTYTVTVAPTDKATVSVDKTSAKATDPVTVTVSEVAAGYVVAGVSVSCETLNQTVNVTDNLDGTYTFNMPTDNVTVAVTFNKIDYTITVGETQNGSVEPSKTTANVGDEITLTITPAEDFVLETLTVKDAENNEITVTDNKFIMPASNVTVTATFRALQVTYWVVWGVTPEGSDSWENENWLKMNQSGDNFVLADQDMAAFSEFKIVKKVQDGDNDPNPVNTWYGAEGSNLYWITVQLLGKNINLFPNGSYANLYIPKDGTFSFTFTPATATTNAVLVVDGVFDYNITVNNTTPNYGTVTAPAKAKAGDEVELTVTPNEGYEVGNISVTYVNGDNTEEVPVTDNKFNMPAADVTVTATFKETVVEYHYGAVEEVKCTVLDQTNYSGFAPEGANITMRIVPSSDTKLKEVIVNKVTGSGQDMVETPIEYTITVLETGDIDLSFVMPAMDVEIHAICADAYAVTVNAGDHGSAQANVIEAYEGETVTVTTTPATEYKVDEIYYTYTVNGVEQRGELTAGENGVYTFAMPAAPVTVVVTFKTILDYYKLKFDAAPTGGTVSVKVNGESIQSMDEVAEFSPVNVTVTPDENYEIDSFKVYEGIVNADDDLTDADEVTYTVDNGIYRFAMPRTDATILVSFKQIQIELEGVVFTADRKWATYYNGTKNLALPQGVKAYVVNGVVNDAVDIDEIDYIPAGVGVLLYSEIAAEQVMTTLYTGETGSYTSMLVGSDEAQTITSGYVLYNNNFIRSEGGTVAAHRCYLPATQVSGAPRILKIGVNGVPTAIENIIAQGNVAGIKYVNLNGMTSNEPFRGINIAVITFTDGTTRTMKVVK